MPQPTTVPEIESFSPLAPCVCVYNGTKVFLLDKNLMFSHRRNSLVDRVFYEQKVATSKAYVSLLRVY